MPPPPTENVFTPMDFGYEGDYLTCLTDEEYKVDMWQYTNKGTVPGIKGNADINLWFPCEAL